MDEKPVGTPNPLNPVRSVEPAKEPAAETAPVEPVQDEPIQDEPIPIEPIQDEPIQDNLVPVDLEPTDRIDTEPILIEEPRKRMKIRRPFFVFAIILFIISAGLAITAAALILNASGPRDAVPAAISRLFSGNIPQNITMEGTIANYENGEAADSLKILVNFSSKINIRTNENLVEAKITANLSEDDTFTFKASEIHTKNGDLYLRLGGIYNALNNYKETNCVGDDSGMTNCIKSSKIDSTEISVLNFIDIFDVVDDEWVRIPNSDFSNLNDVVPGNAITSCLVSAAENLSEYGSGFVSLYEKNPFIGYSTADIDIEKKNDQIYRLSFNAENLTSFINSIGNSGFANELLSCVGGLATNDNITTNEVATILAAVPAIYVEIDNDDNFTRLYMTILNTDEASKTIVDVSFEYPESTVEIEEPTDYINLGDLLSDLLSQFYGTDITEAI